MRALPVDTITLEQLMAFAPAQTLVLTVNNRLTRTLKAQIAEQITNGSIELPETSPWTTWLTNQVVERLYQDAADSFSQVLDTQTVRLIWAQAIAACEAERSLIDVDQVAALAADADTLMLNWGIEVPEASHTPDYERFLAWRAAYEDQLSALDAIDVPRVAPLVAQWITSNRLRLPEQVVLMGFADCSVAMRVVLDALMSAGVGVFQLKWLSTNEPARVGKVALPTPERQWTAAIDWAKQQLSAHPDGRFAIVVPDLQTQSTEARRLLTRDLPDLAVNVAVAPPLSQWPLTRAMLSWLRVAVQLSSLGRIEPAVGAQALMAGGCAGSAAEAGARAMIDARWRHKQWLVLSESVWTDEIRRAPILSKAWSVAWLQWQESGTNARSWYDWANACRRFLAALGFASEGTQTSVQYQVSTALDQLISTLAGLDDCLPAPNALGMWHMLNRLAGQTPFQPQRDPRARLDVLGLLEAEGGCWDGVWVMGVTDDVLPAVVNPNPLIPVQALARAGAPRSTAKREYEWAEDLMQALRQTGDEVIFSWAEQEGEQPNRPSPFLAELPDIEDVFGADEKSLERVELSVWADEPVIEVNPQEEVGGGVAVLQTQAANPLWAFFQYRLRARGLPAHAQWPSSQARGNLLHKTLEQMWNQWGNQARMLDATNQVDWPTELSCLIDNIAVRELAQWPAALSDLERARAKDVLQQWLSVEASRAPFKVIEREGKHDLIEGPLRLKLTIDRIDELPDGQRIVFDYKSGAWLPSPDKDWQSMSFGNPQLLVYASVLSDQGKAPDALAWIRLHASESKIKGISAIDTEVPGIEPWDQLKWPDLDWQTQMSQWDARVRTLAKQFAQGRHDNVSWARDDLKYCTIKPLLRLHTEVDDE